MNDPDCLLPIEVEPQPTETTCGPTCLAAVYQFWNRSVSPARLIADIEQLDSGGTLAVDLACDALRRGFDATIITYNVQIFDPTWFDRFGELKSVDLLRAKLKAQYNTKSLRSDVDSQRLRAATQTYLEFLALGGRLCMKQLDAELIVQTLAAGIPILCGLSATYLYMESRERNLIDGNQYSMCADDVQGDPQGHFVMLHGYRDFGKTVHVADPLHPNPMAPTGKYEAPFARVVSAILLGIVTYDANLLLVRPKPDAPL